MSEAKPLVATPPPAHQYCPQCFFVTTDEKGIMYCCVGPPLSRQVDNRAEWPRVFATDWCGHGYNPTTGLWYTPNGAQPGF